MKYFIGILIGGAVGFLFGYIWNKFQKKEKSDSIKLNVSSYLVSIGELRVYRAYMKEIVTSVDHVWGDIGKKYFSWMLSEKKLAMVFEFEVDFVYNLSSKTFLSSKWGILVPNSSIEEYVKAIIYNPRIIT